MMKLLLIAALFSFAAPAYAQCGEPGAQLQVLVKGKTGIRRGPGLNYPVSAFLEDGRCMKASDLSVDGNWVMVDDPVNKALGWVPIKALDPASIELLSTTRPKATKAPVGSGQERGYVSTLRPIGLLVEPKRGAKDKRTLPASARVLALAITVDRTWVQVRNERNESGWVMASDLEDTTGTLAALPVADNGISTGSGPVVAGAPGPVAPAAASSSKNEVEAPPPSASSPGVTAPSEEPIVPSSPGSNVTVELRGMGLIALPQHGLESDGNSGLRRYAVRANAGGGYFEMRAGPLGPMEIRLSYGILLMGGMATAADPNEKLSGQQHDARLLFAVPIDLSFIEIIPEAGYTAMIYSMTPALPSRDEPTFFSQHTHLLTLGGRIRSNIAGLVVLEVGAHGMLGSTTEYPFDLGQSGLTTGWRFGADAQYRFSSAIGLVVRWEMRNLKAPFVGPAPIDVTITTSRLVHAEQQFSAGMSFRF